MATQTVNHREERGQTIAQHIGQVKRIDENLYTVKSQSGNGEYAVSRVDGEWLCECPDNKYREAKCKHIYAVEFSKSFRAEVSVARIQPLDSTSKCVFCSSEQIVRNAVRHNKAGDIQRYLCKACGKRFSVNVGFERMRATPQVITSAMQLYFTGESFRNVMKFLRLQGVKLSHVTVLRWVRKYIRLMESYVERMKPNVSDTWRADEIRMKVKGDMKYLFAVMDDETRFWIAQEVADTKHYHDTRNLFLQAKNLMGKQPKTIVTDGLYSFCGAAEVVLDEA
ncbi:MAG: transposase, partial [Candidatus Bathyarchaeia archaeon]